jgi:phytoene dehydrogenase-like protein
MAGLAAGIRLAMYDRRVLILEKHNAPGGLNSFYFLGGRKFDVGLHAVTNFSGPDGPRTPLDVLLRQLRIPKEALQLSPQNGSRIAFPGRDLRFSNDFSLLESEVASIFPRQIDGFRRLRQAVLAHDETRLDTHIHSAREVVGRHISDPVLQDMLFCPLMYYGSARERDMDFEQYVTLWKAIFEQGFGRPLEGVRTIIRLLLDRYRALGGERRMKCGVRRILIEGNRARGVELDNGEEIYAAHIISTAGLPETRVLCGESRDAPQVRDSVGQLSFAETVSVLEQAPARLGCGETIIFFNDSDRFHYQRCDGPVDLRSGVVCFPNNYRYPDGEELPEGLLRITVQAGFEQWSTFAEEEYRRQKEEWFPRIVRSGLRFVPGMDPGMVESATVFRDMFTPRTIRKYTGHLGGAVYGSPDKSRSGRTHLENLCLAGTDQGFLGIVGAMLSGVSMANRHVLMG